MNLGSVTVKNLPLESHVSYSTDIQTYVSNMLSGFSYKVPNNFMNAPVAQMLSSMMVALSSVIRTFGGKVQTYDASSNDNQPLPAVDNQPLPAVFTVTFTDEAGNVLKSVQVQEHGSVNASDIPPAPSKDGYTFKSWSHALTDIISDVQVTPLYDKNNENPADHPIATYVVTFIGHNNALIDIQNVIEGNTPTYPTPPHVEGYEFVGWDTQAMNVTAPMTITAIYQQIHVSPITHTVKFWDYTAGFIKNVIVNNGEDVSSNDIPQLEKTGYTLIGWDPQPINITSDVIVISQWRANEYSVTFNSVSGNVVGENQITVTYEQKYGALPSATYEGYDFNGWYLNGTQILSNTIVETASDHELSAQWTEVPQQSTHTVTFIGKDGIEISNIQVQHGHDVTENDKPSAPELIGYSFNKWNDECLNVTSDIIVSALYDPNKYIANIYANDGSIISAGNNVGNQISIEITYDQSYGELPSAIYEGYMFNGWYTQTGNQILSSTIVSVIHDIDIYADWIKVNIIYNVAFIDKNGNLISSVQVEDEHDVNENDIPTPPLETGYTFNRWSSSMSNITADVEISALYTANTYIATFDCSHGGIIIDASTGQEIGDNGVSYSMQVTYDQPYRNIPSCLLQDYTFDGWRIANKPGSKVLSSTIVKTASNHRLIPRQLSAFNVEFIDWDGQIFNEQTIIKNGNAIEPEHPQTKPGYSFDKWSASLSNITADIEISAMYSPNQYVISFDPNGGTMPDGNNYTISVTYENPYGQLPSVYYRENIFDGWYNQDIRVINSTLLSTPYDHTLCAHWTPDLTDEEFNAMLQQFQENLNSMSSDSISSEYSEYSTTYNGEDENSSNQMSADENNDYDEQALSNISIDALLNIL